MDDVTARTIYYLYLLLSIFLPIILGTFFWNAWLKFVRTKFLAKQEHILLEFRLPKEITKSPAAMELFISALNQTGGEGTWWDLYIDGGMRPWFSLELVSLEGQVKFFIWTRKGFKKMIETQLYSQYPDVEVAEVEDYTDDFVFDPKKNDIFGTYFRKSKDSFYPIKTYVDFGLDKDPKEEVKIDPITPVLEYLGSIGPGEQIWFQIIIRAHKKEMTKPGTKEKVDWGHFAKEEVAAKMKRNKGDGEVGDRLTKGEKGAIEAIERSVSKLAFDVGMRGIYLADKEVFNKGMVPGLRGAFRQFGTTDLNSIAPKDSTSFDFPWQDFRDIRLNERKAKMIKYYKQRAFFRPAHQVFLPDQFLQGIYSLDYNVYNTEELATLFHFPGKVSRTPTMTRINSKKATAPGNLPI